MTTHEKWIEKTREHVEQLFKGEGSGHDYQHIYRVWKMAYHIAEEEGANKTISELGALLHDIADWKFYDGDDTIGPKKAEEWMKKIGVDYPIIEQVKYIVASISFKGSEVATPMTTLEGKTVQDADRLDAIGAVGIGRAFAFGGNKNRLMYHPEEPPVVHQSFEAYKKNKSHTINHFYEKLLLLKDRMNTETGKKIAKARHQFMEEYLDRFLREWNGYA